MTHRDLPASGRGCFAAVMIAPIAAFAGLTALTTLLNAPDEATGPALFGLPHPTRASQTMPMDTEEQQPPSDTTIAEQPLALHKPAAAAKQSGQSPSSAVMVPSTVVASSVTRAVTPDTPCVGPTTPITTPSATTSSPVPTTTMTTTTATTATARTTTTAPPPTTTATVAPTTTTTTSASNTRVPQ
ncbi:hypothetical protein [Kutzneria sp. NPDC051319]|uniref:hypothetical protein n=1 Tax=Kutzneria sp. NPDC051319 TaxID=3155047 RepID=UPI00342EEAD0